MAIIEVGLELLTVWIQDNLKKPTNNDYKFHVNGGIALLKPPTSTLVQQTQRLYNSFSILQKDRKGLTISLIQ